MMQKSNKKYKHILIIIGIFLFLTGFRLVWLTIHMAPEQPNAQQGVLDLRNYELPEDQSITLDGEWAFFPKKLIDPLQGESQSSDDIHVSVPTSQENILDAPYGTYRLRILLNDDQVNDGGEYAIRLPSAKTASALFANGKLIGTSGEVGETKHEHQGEDTPYTAFLIANQSEIDLVLHVSNFDTPEGVKLGKTMKFGTTQAIVSEQDFLKTLILSIVVVLIVHSLYAVLVYVFIAQNKVFLFFAIGFLLPALDELITFNKGVMSWLPLNYDWSLKLINLIYLGSVFFFVQLMRVLLTNKHEKIFRWYSILYSLSALSIIFMPTYYLFPADTLFFVLYFVSFLTVIFFAFKEFFQDQDESFYLIFITLSTTSGIVWGAIKGIAAIDMPFYPFDYLLAFLGFAAFWFKRFFKTNVQNEKLVKQLQQADKRKDEFLANTSHELRNPLHGIINIAHSLLENKTNNFNTDSKERLQLLITIGRQMTTMLHDLTDVARLKEKEVRLIKKSLDLHSVASGVVDMLRLMTENKPIQFVIDIPASFPAVAADENRLIQILYNLIHNAIKYTNEGTITIRAYSEGKTAYIEIEDTGIGIDEETQKRIFNPYEQGNQSNISTLGGLGLGLSICKQLIELHGGILDVHSVNGQGSIFTFTLPVAAKDTPLNEIPTIESSLDPEYTNAEIPAGGEHITEDATSRSLTETSNLEKAKILAVDDDPINLKVISMLLPPEEYELVTVASSDEALAYLNKKDWDLIIIDVMLPQISGYELTRIVREQFSLSELPILLLTARNQPEDIVTGFVSGANDYVTKPIEGLELKVRINTLTNLKQSISDQLKTEAAWLQAQIQPHFLFNTLNTIVSLSEIDTTRMTNLLIEFGNYLRRSFEPKKLQQVVPLEHELELLRSYLFIEKERFGERLRVVWEVDKLINIQIPPLTIQPLVENAIRHGILKQLKGGTIYIRITDHEQYVKVAIEDDGIGMDEEELNELLTIKPTSSTHGVGLYNTNRRLIKMFGKGLEITSKLNEGTTVSFKVKKVPGSPG